MLDVGSHVPAARVHTTPYASATIAELTGGGPILLLFYLFDWSSTCTDEVGVIGERHEELRAAGIEPYGVSRDSPWTHLAWAQALDLTVPLLSDWNGEATRAFDVGHTYRDFSAVSERCAFIVDSDGVVRFARSYGASEVPDVDELLDAARSLGTPARA
jgi:peroxiredoxin